MKDKNKIKRNNLSSKETAAPKNDYDWDEYLSVHSLQMMPANNAFKERLFIEMVKWAKENPDALIMDDFYLLKEIQQKDVWRWMEKEPKFKECYQTALAYIASRREKGAIKKAYDSKTIHFMMPHYSKAWRDEQERQSKLGINTNQSPNIKVVIEPFEDKE